MKNLKLLFTTFALILAGVAGFSYGGTAPEPETVIGHIKFFGNAPVEFPGLETDDGKLYTIQVAEGAKFTLKDITAAQGNKIELTGIIDDSQKIGLNVLKDGVIVVTAWKKL